MLQALLVGYLRVALLRILTYWRKIKFCKKEYRWYRDFKNNSGFKML